MCRSCNEGSAFQNEDTNAGGFASDEALSALRRKLTGQPSPPRRSLDSFLDELAAEISELDNRIATLIARLHPVLGPAYPEACDPSAAEDSPEESVIASMLRDRIDYIGRLQQDVRRVTERLEL